MNWKVVCIVLGLAAGPALADTTKASAPAGKIDLVICLDTSNSMDGLIESAKRKLWDIVNNLAQAKPTPQLRVGLYSYGNDHYDPRAGWVRKELDFTTDLDKVSEKLFGLTTKGGTEYAGRVCRDAIAQLQWSDGPGVLKLIFVCGNEAATQDPEIKLKPLAETAVRKGIIINTIYCGAPASSESRDWQEFARLAEGRFVCIDQARGVVAISTPMDADLAKLSTKLNGTYCFYGKEAKQRAENQAAQDSNAEKAGLSVAAARGQSKGGAVYRMAEVDLVDRLKEDATFDVKKVKAEELSEEMRKMTPEKREEHVRRLLTERTDLQKQISELGKKREEYIQAALKKNRSKTDQGLDEAIRDTLRMQAKNKGIQLPE